MIKIVMSLLLGLYTNILLGQDLLNMVPDSEEKEKEFVETTFKSNRTVLGQSVEQVAKGNLNMAIQHNFGALNSGFKNFYGLDNANTAINFEYGINDRINVGIGRSTYLKTFMGTFKYKPIMQSNTLPISVAIFAGAYNESVDRPELEPNFEGVHQWSYISQLLIARKFSSRLSAQVTPTYLHFNLVKTPDDANDLFALDGALRFKLTNWVSVNGEYAYVFNNNGSETRHNFFGLGFDLDTGGHVFQLRFSNASGLYEPNYIAKTNKSWLDGDIHFGFTINRSFTILKK